MHAEVMEVGHKVARISKIDKKRSRKEGERGLSIS